MELRFENGLAGTGWLMDRMNGFLREYDGGSSHYMVPAADVVEDKDAYHFYFELPGLKNESIDVRVEDGRLIVAAERKRPEWSKETEIHVTERAYGPIRRVFALPKDASNDTVRATYRDGILEIMVEKRPETKPVKIQIN